MLNKSFWFRLSSSPRRQQQSFSGKILQKQVNDEEKEVTLCQESNVLQKSVPILSRKRKSNKDKGFTMQHYNRKSNNKFIISQRHNSNPQSGRALDLSLINLSKDVNNSADCQDIIPEVIHARKETQPRSIIKRRKLKVKQERQEAFQYIKLLSNEKYAKKMTIEAKQKKQKPKEIKSQRKFQLSRIRGIPLVTDKISDKKPYTASKFSNLRHRPSINYRPWSPQKLELIPCQTGQEIDLYLQTTH